MDKRTKSAWMLGGCRVHGFHKWVDGRTVDWIRGLGVGVWGTVFLAAHRRVLRAGGESRDVCGE